MLSQQDVEFNISQEGAALAAAGPEDRLQHQQILQDLQESLDMLESENVASQEELNSLTAAVNQGREILVACQNAIDQK